MIYRLFLFIALLFIFNCSKPPEVIPDMVVDLSYEELKQNYHSCRGEGIMTAKGLLPWKLNYSFTTQNDSSFMQFKDVFGRRVLFVQATPQDILLWDMLKNHKYKSVDGNSIALFSELNSKDIAEILWGEIPSSYSKSDEDALSSENTNSINFVTTSTQFGDVLERISFNLESQNADVEFIISDRKYGESNKHLLRGIPEEIPFN